VTVVVATLASVGVLTPALAIQLLGPGIGVPQPLRLAPDDTTCTYQTDAYSSVSLELSDAAILESEPLWHAPPYEGSVCRRTLPLRRTPSHLHPRVAAAALDHYEDAFRVSADAVPATSTWFARS
jgi:hypothetical protein